VTDNLESDISSANFFEKILADLPSVNSQPLLNGSIRQHHSDFIVTEELSFSPSGSGEHLFLLIEKQGCNTEWVVRQLKQHFSLTSKEIGYAGRKDRHSIARQWFSLHLPGKSVSLESLKDASFKDDFRVIENKRHNKKLKQGAIKYNHFEIIVRDVSGKIDESAIECVKKNGFPNYFGYQRFGRNAQNLSQAERLLTGQLSRKPSKNQRSLYLSAARSYLFNLMVGERIKQDLWSKVIPGDCLGFADSRSFFVCEQLDEESKRRFAEGDLHISGWLAGKGYSEAQGDALAMEKQVIQDYELWLQGLTKEKVLSARRLMRVIPNNLQVTSLDEKSLLFKFSLPTGSFATSLLRELIQVNDASLSM